MLLGNCEHSHAKRAPDDSRRDLLKTAACTSRVDLSIGKFIFQGQSRRLVARKGNLPDLGWIE